MKNKLQNYLFLFLTLLFLLLIFKYNIVFKNCIIEGSSLFFYQVFPTLFPMFIINDLLFNYNFGYYLNKLLHTIFAKIFKMNSSATYILILSLFSGTPTNAYVTANFIENKLITAKEAGIILTYAFFINPLFLYNMLQNIFHNSSLSIKIIFICYVTNLVIAFVVKKYPYSQNHQITFKQPLSFSNCLSLSLNKSLKTLLNILGTIIFYLILSAGLNIFIKNNLLNCLFNGFLEVTGGLNKLALLNINFKLKQILAIIFITFGGFSIHTQIKGIIIDYKVPYLPLFLARVFQAILATSIFLITT